MPAWSLWGLLVWLGSGCSPELIVGTWSKPFANGGASGAGAVSGASSAGTVGGGMGGAGGASGAGAAGGAGGAGGAVLTGGASGDGGAADCDPTLPMAGAPPMGSAMDPVAVPWTTSFEDEFCGYVEARGYCYVDGDATYEVVNGPAHTGTSAVAFSVNSEDAAAQTRCVRQGVFPRDAFYGAWFYLDARAESAGLWNLMYFQGNLGNGDGSFEAQWDVSIGTDADGVNSLFIFDHVRGDVLTPAGAPQVPVRTWFHIELRIRRAADETGVAELYQDDELIYETPPLITDTTPWGQWYVGNLARGRTPAESTVYVDDVSIRAAP